MPKLTKCWYNNCDSDNRQNPKLLFYKFPKDTERCEQWINNCANEELTAIWLNSPAKVGTFRVCQKHFLKEFLGTSSRLVGHAVPAPYGVPLDQLNAEKFMVECASLKSTSLLNKQQKTHPHQESQVNDNLVYGNMSNQVLLTNTCITGQFNHSLVVSNSLPVPVEPGGLLITVDQRDYQQQLIDSQISNENGTTALYSSSCDNQYIASYNDSDQTMLNGENMTDLTQTLNISQQGVTSTQINPTPPTNQINTEVSPGPSRLNRNTNPKINYDRGGKVISIQYPTETLSMIKTNDNDQHQEHIIALKHKVRHYQRKLAVINHRYQKLKGQIKGRSNKMRLLECLKICKDDFDPCVFEIFKRQIKGPTSKQGNRWSNDVKTFSSSIYIRSRAAYKFIRKTIDLPSESIVKRYIGDKKLSKLSRNVQEGDDTDGDTELDETGVNSAAPANVIVSVADHHHHGNNV